MENLLFKEILRSAEKKLKSDGEEASYDKIIKLASSMLIELNQGHEAKTIGELQNSNDAYISRNKLRWRLGFQKLHALRETSLEAGEHFRNQFISIDKYCHDPLLGVLLRQHANACRISEEIIHLLEGGFPDAALARWRTLFEIMIVCMVLRKHGTDCAIDYIKHGTVKNTEGILEYQKTAKAMNLPPFTEEEIDTAKRNRDEITNGEHWHWALKHTGFSKLEKLREYVGMDHWSHNYKLASRNIHADYFEMSTLLAMSEAKEDIFLVGRSNSGFTDPAHMMAISLSTITCMLILTYSDVENSGLDFTDSLLFMNVIDNYVKEVGDVFLEIQNAK